MRAQYQCRGRRGSAPAVPVQGQPLHTQFWAKQPGSLLDELDAATRPGVIGAGPLAGVSRPPTPNSSRRIGTVGLMVGAKSGPSRAAFDVGPGDVLMVLGAGHVARVGTTTGVMGHAMLVVGPTKALDASSCAAQQLFASSDLIWCVPTLESCRDRKGLHQAQMLLRTDPATGCISLVGELVEGAVNLFVEEEVQVWQSPPEVRSEMASRLVSEVLSAMKASQKDWSFVTAAWALFSSAQVHDGSGNPHLLKELQACWQTPPICTAVVITFWQRYLCLLATATGQPQLDLVLRFMPLKADRCLPKILTNTMSKCGWVVMKLPRC